MKNEEYGGTRDLENSKGTKKEVERVMKKVKCFIYVIGGNGQHSTPNNDPLIHALGFDEDHCFQYFFLVLLQEFYKRFFPRSNFLNDEDLNLNPENSRSTLQLT